MWEPVPVQMSLLAWSETNLRDLAWRRARDPWSILVAETMLQQTQVARVETRWVRFLAHFPDPSTCASASIADLLREWQGLGYNRRALMLHRAATVIRDRHDGEVPDELDALLDLPGVGPYTARAVLAFAFERRAAPVDTNIGRVLARVAGRRLAPAEAQRLADSLVPEGRSWLWNQGIMELGATICAKRSPDCEACPLSGFCEWRGSGADPAEGSAAVGRPQAAFEGSNRQLRGRVIDTLRRGPVSASVLGEGMATDDEARRGAVIDALLADGLIEHHGGRYRLAGDVDSDLVDQAGPVNDASKASMA